MTQPLKPFARLSSEQWRHIINEQLESGLSQKNFCLSRDISITTFTHWKRKLREDFQSPHDPDNNVHHDWIEIPSAIQQPAPTTDWHLELELPGGVILRMRQ